MTFEAKREEIQAAEAYEALHVPALFAAWAPLVAEAAGVGPGQDVLDVACGTGVLARYAAGRVGPDGAVTGLDASAGMLSVAARLAPRVSWRQGRAGALPFPDGSFGRVVSQHGLMFFPDRPAAAREMLRVLRPGGRFAVAVWDSLEKSPPYPDAVALLDRRAGRSAGDALLAPFVLGDRDALVALFEGAGAVSVQVERRSPPGRFPDVRTMVEADLRGWLPAMGVILSEEVIAAIL